MKYFHVDVFSSEPLGGNGLAVAFPDRDIATASLQGIAREFNQFETAFIYPRRDGAFPVRIFTVEEELPFAGHPLLGSAAMIHRTFISDRAETPISISLGERIVRFTSIARLERDREYYSVTMNQGTPSFLGQLDPGFSAEIAASVGLGPGDIDDRYRLEVVSTGLPYLLIPLRSGIDRARVAHAEFERFLSRFGAKFAYLFDTATLECRTWDNGGRVEDVATGSAAGPLCAYLAKNGYRPPDDPIVLSQGGRVGRPSRIECRYKSGEVYILGDVSLFAEGTLYQ